MAEDKITPEEKLLKVIENPLNLKGKPPSAIMGGSKDFIFRWLRDFKQKKFKVFISLKNVHKTLTISSVVITVIGGGAFVKGHNDFKERLKDIMSQPQSNFKKEQEGNLLSVNLTEAVEDSKRRNIFTSSPAKPEVAVPKTLEQTISKLKLVGIIWSAKPQTMIEDTVLNKTFLLGVDETVGDFKIKKILRDRVVISKDGQEWELR